MVRLDLGLYPSLPGHWRTLYPLVQWLNLRHNSTSPDTFAEVETVTNQTGLWDAELAWYSPSTTRRICWGWEGDKPHWTVRCRAHLILSECYSPNLLRSRRWQTTLDCEMPSSPDTLRVPLAWFASTAWGVASTFTLLGPSDLAWSSTFLQHERNFSNHQVTILWSVESSPFTRQIFLIAYAALWLCSNL